MPVSLSMAPSVHLLAVRWRVLGPRNAVPICQHGAAFPGRCHREDFCNLALGGFHNLAWQYIAEGLSGCRKDYVLLYDGAEYVCVCVCVYLMKVG